MVFNVKLVLLAFATAVVAQSSGVPNASASGSPTGSAVPIPSGLGITPCIIGCVQPAATNVGCAFTDPTCVCVNDQFKAAATACLQANCTAQEVATAENLQQMECAAIAPSGASSASGAASTGAAASSAASGGVGASSGAAGSATKTSPAATSPAATSPPAAATSNAALPSAASGMWVLAAGLLGAVAAAL